MGKRRQPNVGTHRNSHDGESINELPPFARFVDVSLRDNERQESTRIYFATPTHEEMRNLPENITHVVGAGNRPKSGQGYSGIEEVIGRLINPEFAREHCQLMEVALPQTKFSTYKGLSRLVMGQKHFAKYLASDSRTSAYKSILEITIDDWIGFRDYLIASKLKAISIIWDMAVMPFLLYAPTNFDDALYDLGTPKRKKITREHTSNFVEPSGSYSDSTMYQILMHSIFHFYRGISYLERYSALSAETMPENWIPPNCHKRKDRVKNINLLNCWLASEEGYQIILDHKLYYHKLGLRGHKAFNMVMHVLCRDADLMEALKKYNEWEQEYHYLNTGRKSHVGSLYSKNAPDDTGAKYLEFCLANIALIYTGLNKEVLLSWPSQIDGRSILENFDTLFISYPEKSTDIIIPGYKSRVGTRAHKKLIRTVINLKSPLYTMLKLYEKHAKIDSNGPFFEMIESRRTLWTRADFTKKFPIYLEDKSLLKAIDTTKFRKVFATAKLLQLLEGSKTANDIAEKLKLALNHASFNTTLQYYLFKSATARGVIDIAIAALTEDKLLQSTHFQGQTSKQVNAKHKKLYLCECKDPKNPSHDLPIAEECTYYDNCLGCKRSVISTLHLPYICYRILQYEQAREILGSTWNVVYEDKWLIAHDALKNFKQSYPELGEELISAAWAMAKSGQITLPAIFTVF